VAQSSLQGKARKAGGQEGGREERVEGDNRVGRGLHLQVATGGGGAGAVVVAQPSLLGVCSGCGERRARGAEVRSDGREERRASGAASGGGTRRERGGELASAMGGGRRGGGDVVQGI
jgi:hypothetical protein